MSIVGCYVVHIYCDNPHCRTEWCENDKRREASATTYSHCRGLLRKAGWYFGKSFELCPDCARDAATRRESIATIRREGKGRSPKG